MDIIIKKSTISDKPASLKYGELAYSDKSKNLFIGNSNNTIQQLTNNVISNIVPTNIYNGLIWREIDNNGNYVNDWEYVSNLNLWLSLQTYRQFLHCTNNSPIYSALPSTDNCYLLDMKLNLLCSAINNVNNYNVVTLTGWNLSNTSVFFNSINTINQSVANRWYKYNITLNFVFDANSYSSLGISRQSIVGSGGTLHGNANLNYRLIRG